MVNAGTSENAFPVRLFGSFHFIFKFDCKAVVHTYCGKLQYVLRLKGNRLFSSLDNIWDICSSAGNVIVFKPPYFLTTNWKATLSDLQQLYMLNYISNEKEKKWAAQCTSCFSLMHFVRYFLIEKN